MMLAMRVVFVRFSLGSYSRWLCCLFAFCVCFGSMGFSELNFHDYAVNDTTILLQHLLLCDVCVCVVLSM